MFRIELQPRRTISLMEPSYNSRRSPVFSTAGMVACTQPVAADVGRSILAGGGNAMDAAVAMAAGMQLCEPCSTGLGGDCFVLWYDAKTKTVSAMNGSGRSPSALTLERATADLAASSSAAATAAGCLPALHPHTITIPGAAAGWCDALDKWGTLPMSTVLAPVIDIAKRGFPVSPITAHNWSEGQRVLKHWRLAAAASAAATTDGGGSNGKPAHLPRDQPESLLVLKAGVEPGSARDLSDYRAPMAGEVFRNPALASTLELLAREGKAGFYSRTSPIARSIIEAVQSVGGVMSHEDLEAHVTTFPEALCVGFCGLKVWECPPNGQGIVALMALNIMKEAVAAQLQRAGPGKEEAEHRVGDPRQSGPAGSTPAAASSASSPSTTSSASSYCGFNLSTSLPLLDQDDVAILHHLASLGHNSAQYLHLVIEALRLAFADARQFVADPDVVNVPSAALLSSAYAKKRAALIHLDRAAADIAAGQPQTTCDTVSFQVVDKDGNACAFINSNYMGFGSGLVPIGCGFSLQNRGANFSLQPGHPNALAPSKRPYHTIIPAMVTDRSDNLVACYSNMGGFMQPQGHLQLLLNMLAFNCDPQTALDLPRICIADGSGNGAVSFEEGIDEEAVVKRLAGAGHRVVPQPLAGWSRSLFGRGQVILKHPTTGVLWGGSDGRGDGCIMAAF